MVILQPGVRQGSASRRVSGDQYIKKGILVLEVRNRVEAIEFLAKFVQRPDALSFEKQPPPAKGTGEDFDQLAEVSVQSSQASGPDFDNRVIDVLEQIAGSLQNVDFGTLGINLGHDRSGELFGLDQAVEARQGYLAMRLIGRALWKKSLVPVVPWVSSEAERSRLGP